MAVLVARQPWVAVACGATRGRRAKRRHGRGCGSFGRRGAALALPRRLRWRTDWSGGRRPSVCKPTIASRRMMAWRASRASPQDCSAWHAAFPCGRPATLPAGRWLMVCEDQSLRLGESLACPTRCRATCRRCAFLRRLRVGSRLHGLGSRFLARTGREHYGCVSDDNAASTGWCFCGGGDRKMRVAAECRSDADCPVRTIVHGQPAVRREYGELPLPKRRSIPASPI